MTQPMGETRPFTFDDLKLPQLERDIEGVNDFMDAITDQNEREVALLSGDYGTAGVLFSDPQLEYAAKLGLAEEQQATKIEVMKAVGTIPYEEIGRLLLELSKQHVDLVVTVASQTGKLDSYFDELKRDTETAIRFAPHSAEYLMALAQHKYVAKAEGIVERLLRMTETEIQPEELRPVDELRILSPKLEVVQMLFDLACAEWDRPRVDFPERDTTLPVVGRVSDSFREIFSRAEPSPVALKAEAAPPKPEFAEQPFDGGDLNPGHPDYEKTGSQQNPEVDRLGTEEPVANVVDELSFDGDELGAGTDPNVESGWPPEGFYDQVPRERLTQFVQQATAQGRSYIIASQDLVHEIFTSEQLEDGVRTKRGDMTNLFAPGHKRNMLDELDSLGIKVYTGKLQGAKVYQFLPEGASLRIAEGYENVEWQRSESSIKRPKQ